MSDVSGSGAEATPGSPAPSNGSEGAQNGSGANGSADPFAGLETGSRDWVEKAGYKTVEDVVNGARNAESLLGKSVRLPGDDAKPEDWAKFQSDVSKHLPAEYRAPESVDGYEFKLPDGVPEEMPYDDDFAKSFKEQARELGLAPKTASQLHDFTVQHMAKQFESSRQAMGERATKQTEELEQAWGKTGSDEHKAKLDSALRALKGLDLEDSFKAAGFLVDVPDKGLCVMDAKAAKALATVGDALYREANALEGEGTGSEASNPFADSNWNMTEQNRIWNTDRPRAERLMRAAGKTPKELGFSS